MVNCVASENCKSNSRPKKSPNQGEKVHFFNVPKDEKLRLQWQNQINRPNFVLRPNHRVCHKHFRPEEIRKYFIIKDSKGNIVQQEPLRHLRLEKGAVPTLNLSQSCKRKRDSEGTCSDADQKENVENRTETESESLEGCEVDPLLLNKKIKTGERSTVEKDLKDSLSSTKSRIPLDSPHRIPIQNSKNSELKSPLLNKKFVIIREIEAETSSDVARTEMRDPPDLLQVDEGGVEIESQQIYSEKIDGAANSTESCSSDDYGFPSFHESEKKSPNESDEKESANSSKTNVFEELSRKTTRIPQGWYQLNVDNPDDVPKIVYFTVLVPHSKYHCSLIVNKQISVFEDLSFELRTMNHSIDVKEVGLTKNVFESIKEMEGILQKFDRLPVCLGF